MWWLPIAVNSDAIVKAEPRKYRRASVGHVQYNFTPNLKKTFNRGFTHYFLNGRQPDIASFDTPKAIGEFVGRLRKYVATFLST